MYMETQEILNCQHCQRKYDEPKLLPCGNTICNFCIKTHLINKKEKKKAMSQKSNSNKTPNAYETLSNEYKCLMCEDNHQYPMDNAFPTNQLISKLLNKNLKLFNFGESATKLKGYVESLQESKLELQELSVGGKSFIGDYCIKIRKDIDLSVEKEINNIYKRQEELCNETKTYEKQTVDAYEWNKDKIHEKLKLNDLFRQIAHFEQSHSNIDVLQATTQAKSLNEKLNETKEQLTKLIFNERIIAFKDNENKSTQGLVGFLKYSK
jgi:hypothetical protein